MPFTDDRVKKFGEMFDAALIEVRQEPHFEDDIQDGALDASDIKNEISAKSDDIWKVVEVKISALDAIEQRIALLESDVERTVAAFRESEAAAPGAISSLTKIIQSSKAQDVPVTEEREKQIASFRLWTEQESGLIGQKAEAEAMRSAISAELTQQIKEAIRLYVNSKISPNYSTRLTLSKVLGLGEVIDPNSMVETRAKASLIYMLETMPGGSIGIAGPRGAGKSTLIQMCCGDKRTLPDIKGVKVLPVYTSAPVQYDSRDFILYLFSTVCQRVLDPEGLGDTKPVIPEVEGYSMPEPDSPVIKSVLLKAPGALRMLGVLLLGFGLLITALISAAYISKQSQTKTPANANVDITASANRSVGNADVDRNSNSTGPSIAEAAKPPAAIEVAGELISQMEIKPGAIIFWGLVLLVASYMTSALRRSVLKDNVRRTLFGKAIDRIFLSNLERERIWEEDSTDFFPASYNDFSKATDERKSIWRDRSTKIGVYSSERRRTLDRYFDRLRSEQESDTDRIAAANWLREIKFQQNFTQGWSGALKLPAGLEGGINRAVTLAQRQMSNPEIVASFIKFLKLVSAKYTIVIGIDELDKMESDEDAQKFLNEIKSIFGLPNCFYLISVSENAMSSFERRGLPFRDVFDSSFDTVVYVDYMTPKTARELLLRRIIGKPLPFIYMSYCLSGGLPRDLIRNFRTFLENNQPPSSGTFEGTEIGELCRLIVVADIKSKIRAIGAAAKKIDIQPESEQFVELLYQIENQQLDEPGLQKVVTDLLKPRPGRIVSETATDQERQDSKECLKIGKLSLELGAYVYFLTTTLQFFSNTLTEDKLKTALSEGDLEKLARSRQLMALNPTITVSILDELRPRLGLSKFVPAATNGHQAGGKRKAVKK
jgi:hypothetical protein